MAVLNEDVVRRAFREQLRNVTGWPSTIAWENRKTEPPNPPALWGQEEVRVLSERQEGNGLIIAMGEWEFFVTVPRGDGTDDAEALLAAMKAALPVGQSIVFETETIHVLRTEPGRGQDFGDAWWMKPLIVTWQVFVLKDA
jgi:hypothetical protein